MTLPIFRASSLSRLLACPASGALPQIRGDGDGKGEAAATGIAGHKFLERLALKDSVGQALLHVDPEHHDMCRRIDLSGIDFGGEIYVEKSYHYRVDIGLIFGEWPVSMPEFSITGTADLVQHRGGELLVTDWKFGRPEYVEPVEDNTQLMFYALCAHLDWKDKEFPAPSKITIRLGFIDQEMGGITFRERVLHPEDLLAFQEALRKALEARMVASSAATPSVTEGPWCHFCHARVACPAKVSLIRQFSQGLMVRPPGDLTAERIGEAWVKAQTLKAAIAEFEAQVEFWVRTQGVVPLPDGKTLALVKRRGNEVLDPDIAAGCVGEELGDTAARSVVKRSVAKQAILDVVKAAGFPNKISEKIIGAVRKAGGVTRHKDSEFMKEVKR